MVQKRCERKSINIDLFAILCVLLFTSENITITNTGFDFLLQMSYFFFAFVKMQSRFHIETIFGKVSFLDNFMIYMYDKIVL